MTCDGCRIESYNLIKEIDEYRKNHFSGNPIYIASCESDFTLWLKKESCGFSESLQHNVIITLNDFIDVASAFPPKLEVIELKSTIL